MSDYEPSEEQKALGLVHDDPGAAVAGGEPLTSGGLGLAADRLPADLPVEDVAAYLETGKRPK